MKIDIFDTVILCLVLLTIAGCMQQAAPLKLLLNGNAEILAQDSVSRV
ncbi:MAG: hypothetical protein ABI813_16040 [Bacteroidota bacterium]